jgi:Domain of unknown function (DUF4123)
MASAAPGNWYAIIDCAQDARLIDLVKACRDHVCLFMGDLDAELLAASPWLVKLDERDPLLSTWQQHGRGGNWGIMCESNLSLPQLRRQFRRFLQAKLPDGMIALFRFYDPRVFNTYIKAALPEEREPWFASISQFAAEGDGGVTHHYSLQQGQLVDRPLQ